jgi:hypothetical protein
MSQGHNLLNHATTRLSRPQVLGQRLFRLNSWEDEEMICAYIKRQEMPDQQLDLLQLKLASS